MRSRRPGRWASSGLADECSAVLEGRYADALAGAGMPVPVWAWVNLLAHGTEDELREAAGTLGTSEHWVQARAFLAGEVIDAAGVPGASLRSLQREVLVPLELELAAEQRPGSRTSGALVERVTDALGAWLSRSRR